MKISDVIAIIIKKDKKIKIQKHLSLQRGTLYTNQVTNLIVHEADNGTRKIIVRIAILTRVQQ